MDNCRKTAHTWSPILDAVLPPVCFAVLSLTIAAMSFATVIA